MTAPDLLRLERFGALHYRRSTSTFDALPLPEARLLVAATARSILDCYARDRCGLAQDDQTFAETVVRWQHAGLLDGSFRCRAQIVDNPRDRSGLTSPLVAHLLLTHACNLQCGHCYIAPTPQPATDELSADEIEQLAAQLAAMGTPLCVISGGEPLRRADLVAIGDSLGRHQLDAWLCTNATLVDEEMAAQLAAGPWRGISISIDGADAATHDRLRGLGNFERAVRGIQLLRAAGVRELQLRVTATRHSAHRLHELAALAERIGVTRIVCKPFSTAGTGGRGRDLAITRAGYDDAIARARERWPDNGVRIDFGDGMPTRPAAWTGIAPVFSCVAGTTSITISPDGRVAGCASLLDDRDWTLRDHSLVECWRDAPGVTRWRRLEPGARCRACSRLAACGGGCRARAIEAGLGWGGVDPWATCPA